MSNTISGASSSNQQDNRSDACLAYNESEQDGFSHLEALSVPCGFYGLEYSQMAPISSGKANGNS
jgi:hypothetical protein